MTKKKTAVLPVDGRSVMCAVKPLLHWYDQNKRSLPWRGSRDPYHIWLSEIMLQQTRVEAVIPYYLRFIEALPTIPSLAAASEERLFKLWEGLGYYSRARNLQKAAQICVERYGGTLPQTYDELLSLPGFGPYTAGAVASIAFGESVPAVDGNVLRVISRLAGYEDDIMLPAVRKAFFGCLLPCMEERPGDLNQAFMDLGALVCLPNGKPRCESCPVSFCCEAHAKGQELLFPVKRTKASRRAEQRTVLVIAAQGRILLHKRPDRGLLAGLWEFVNLEGHLTADEVSAYCRELGLEVKEIMSHKTAKHIFTHIEWHMNSFCVKATRCEEIDGCVWADGFALNERHSVPSAFSAFKETAAELIGLY